MSDEKKDEAAQVVVGVSLYLLADGTLNWDQAPKSPRKPNLNDIHLLATRAIRDVELRMTVEGVCQRQLQLAQQMREAAEEQMRKMAGEKQPDSAPGGGAEGAAG